jgi:F-type H+-transporting ATPase subunit gamma
MSKARTILKRRKAVMNIRKITRTMQLIATARFQKAFNRTMASKPYTRKIMAMAGNLANSSDVAHPLVDGGGAESRKVAVLVITSNRGLAGGYNSRVLEQSRMFIDQLKAKGGEVELEVVGKKGVSLLKFLGYDIEHVFDMPDEPSYEDVEKVAKVYMDHFTAGGVDAVYVSYMQFHSTSKQTPNIMKLLPLEIDQTDAAQDRDHPVIWEHDYEFFPSAGELLVQLLPEAVKVGLYQCFSDAAVSEQVGRMIAMKAATDNAEEMIKHLGSQANRARQSQITGELTELIGGSEALS